MGRILIADDHDAIRRGLVRGLTEAGHEVEEASNGSLRRAMGVDIAIVGLTERQATALHVVDRLGAILAPLGDAALAARLAVSDQNGPKGGVAIRCAIDARVTRWAPLHADARATSARAA